MSDRLPALAAHLEKIPYFVAIAKAGSLQKAARDLRVAQPSLTKSMQVLEEALGASLLRRSRLGVTLTAAGEEFRRFAEPMLASLAVIERHVLEVAGDVSAGALRIGTHEILVREFWPALVRDVRKAFPRLELTLFTHPSVSELIRRLGAAELDVVVCVECPPLATVARQEIRSDCYGFYATRAFLKAQGLTRLARLSAKALVDLPLIYAEDVIAGPGIRLAAALQAAGIDNKSLYKVHSLESVLSLVEGDLGVGLLPRLMVATDRRSRLTELKAPGIAGGRLGVHRLFAATSFAIGKEERVKSVLTRVDELLRKGG